MLAADTEGSGLPARPPYGASLAWQLFWTMAAAGSVGPLAALLASDTPLMFAVGMCGVALALLAAHFATRSVMRQIEELRRRVASRGLSNRQSALDVEGAQEPGEPGHSRLPPELAEIERLAGGSTLSTAAVQSITTDLSRHLAHQLRSPMALLGAHVASARQHIDLGDYPSASASVAAIGEVSMNVGRLVEKLLSIAYLNSAEDLRTHAKPVNLSPSLMQTVRIRSALAADRGVKLTAEVEAGLWVCGQPILLGEMVAVLIDNAVRHSPANGAVRVDAKHIPDTDSICLCVIDEGPGIPAMEREHVFEPFYGGIGLDANGNMMYGSRRDRALRSAESKSHGLGLTIARSIAHLHGTDVVLEDSPQGRGLCACVHLKATDPAPAAARSDPPEMDVHSPIL